MDEADGVYHCLNRFDENPFNNDETEKKKVDDATQMWIDAINTCPENKKRFLIVRCSRDEITFLVIDVLKMEN